MQNSKQNERNKIERGSPVKIEPDIFILLTQHHCIGFLPDNYFLTDPFMRAKNVRVAISIL